MATYEKKKMPKYVMKEFVKHIQHDLCEDVVLTPTSEFPYMKFKFSEFNPLQTMVMPYIDKEEHMVLSAPTGSGKTLVIEMFASWAMAQGRKAIYLSPLKALSNEKFQDWLNLEHDFSDKKVCMVTGDTGGKTEEKISEMNESDMIIMTTELLDSCTRMPKAEYRWIKETKVLLVDESHLISEENRGDKLEAAIMRFTELCPDIRVLLLSATMPNLSDLSKWLTKITGKDCDLIKINYRPCPLTFHYMVFQIEGKSSWGQEELVREDIAKKVIESNSEHSVLTFVSGKNFGMNLDKKLNEAGITSYFYKADLSAAKRTELFNSFYKKEYRSLVSSPGLAWGISLPARVVTISNTKFCPGQDVSSATLLQMAGRSGRRGLDPEGDVYIIVSNKDYNKESRRIEEGQDLTSQMVDKDILAFHLLAEIANKKVRNAQDFMRWFNRSLAASQTGDMELGQAQDVLDWLESLGMIEKVEEYEEIFYKICVLGQISSSMYLPPADVKDWKKNFKDFFSQGLDESGNDWDICRALADISTVKNTMYASALEKRVISETLGINCDGFGGEDKQTVAYYVALNPDPYIALIDGAIRAVKQDLERTMSTLMQMGQRAKLWPDKTDFFKILGARLLYGVPRSHVELCTIPGVGGAIARKLYNNGLRSVYDVAVNHSAVREVLAPGTAEKIIISANDKLGRQMYQPQVQMVEVEELDF